MKKSAEQQQIEELREALRSLLDGAEYQRGVTYEISSGLLENAARVLENSCKSK